MSDLLAPGLHEDVPMADYLALPYMSASRLEVFRRSPLQYQHALDAPPKESDALARGTALHLALLEPEAFADHYVVLGPCSGVTKKGAACGYQGSVYRDGESWCKTHDPAKDDAPDPGVEIIGQRDYDDVLGMRDAIKRHDRARSLFEGEGLFEATVVFDDPATGVRCRVRPDRLVERAGMLVDVKSTRDAVHHQFSRQAETLGYFRKMALYRRALRAIGWPLSEVAVLAIESAAPYDLVPYLLDPTGLDAADDEVTRLLERYRGCAERDEWPGYASDFAVLYRPAWAMTTPEEGV